MKKLSTIMQLPIMEILNGKQVGQTKDIILNLDTKDIAFVLDESTLASFFVIRGADIQSIGRDVVLIKTRQAIQNTQVSEGLFHELGEYYTVMGLCVITSEGNIEGKIVDLTIDKTLKKFLGFELDNGKAYTIDKIISISDKYVFVQEESDTIQGEEITISDSPEEVEKVVVEEAEPVSEVEEVVTVEAKSEEIETESEAEEEKEYLVGMVMTDDVASEDGEFIVKKGTELTGEIINQAKEFGVYANLILNAE